MKFQLLAGRHITGQKEERRIYRIGDVIESDDDLVKRFGGDKFQRVDDDAKATDVNDSRRATLEAMTLKELRKFADDEEIDLGGASRKNEIINVIVEAM